MTLQSMQNFISFNQVRKQMFRRNHSQPWTFLCIIVFSVLSGAPSFCKVRWRPARFELVQRTPARAGREIQPPEIAAPEIADPRRDGDPPVETGRNPQAVALDFIWGIVLIPVVILGMISTYLFGGFLSTVSKPAPSVPLAEALSALTAIEDDYAVRGPSMGLRQRLANWFQWSEPQRRLDFELEDVQNRSARERIRKRGMDAAEDIASVVEYFIAGNGIIDDSGSAKFADRIANDEASRGYPEAERFAEKALHEGRKALAETVTMLEEELEAEE